ncbi:MAG: enolase C-terminal domain-like protein [Pseudomonadota bacterium]
MTSTIQSVSMHEVFVSPKTIWAFVEVTASSGVTGVGEVTFFGREDGIRQQLHVIQGAARGMAVTDREAFLRPRLRRESDRMAHIALSGFEQALIDIQAKELGIAAHHILGGNCTAGVPVYANINRGTADRSADGYAARAREAVAAGYGALKIAPFDGVQGTTGAAVSNGIDVVLAVRDAVGPDVSINIDSHARFSEIGAKEMISAIAEAKPFWIEQPLHEAPSRRRSLQRIRRFANDRGIRIAGAESDHGLDTYREIVNAECMDVLMPDIRMSGGVMEILRIAHLVDGAGLEFSLHNPVGPVLDAISLQVARMAPSVVMLERTFRESRVQNDITIPGFRDPSDSGFDEFGRPGWGIELRHDRLDELAPSATNRHADFHAVVGAGQYA